MKTKKFIAAGEELHVTRAYTFRVVEDDVESDCFGCKICVANLPSMGWLCRALECRDYKREDRKDVHLELVETSLCVDENLM